MEVVNYMLTETLPQGQYLKRSKALTRQFKHSNLWINEQKKASLNRIYKYILNHTDVNFLENITGEILINYIRFHKSLNFRVVSFQNSITDVKTFIKFVNRYHFSYQPIINLSISNYSLWMKL